MAPWHWRGLAAATVAALVLTWAGAAAAAQETRPQGIGPVPPEPTGILVNVPARTLYWYEDGELIRSFPVGVGTASTQTPSGRYRVETMAVDPWWLPPSGGPPVPPGPSNPLGTRWIGFRGGYGIHGNNNPASVGGVVSLGCVRMYGPDVEWLYEQVQIGTPVTVIYEPVLIEYGPGGRRHLAVYPDVYGKGRPEPAQLLAELGLPADTVEVTGPGHYLLDVTADLSGRPLKAVMHRSRPYIEARPVAEQLHASLRWDAGQVWLDGKAVPAAVRDGVLYMDAEMAARLLGAAYRWQEERGHFSLQGVPIYLNGRVISRRAVGAGRHVLVPLQEVAEQVGARVEWEAAGSLARVGGHSVPVIQLDGTAYTPAAALGESLNLRVYTTAGAVAFGYP